MSKHDSKRMSRAEYMLLPRGTQLMVRLLTDGDYGKPFARGQLRKAYKLSDTFVRLYRGKGRTLLFYIYDHLEPSEVLPLYSLNTMHEES